MSSANIKVIVVSTVILGAALVYRTYIFYRMSSSIGVATSAAAAEDASYSDAAEAASLNPSREGGTIVTMDTTNANENCPESYILLDTIGSGSYSNVYRSKNLATDKTVALKKFKLLADSFLYEKTAAEMAFVRFLNHENIIDFVACDIKIDQILLAIEYSPYGSLKNMMHQRQTTPEQFIQLVMKQLISALSYLHSMHIMHGDVKPENIIMTSFYPNFVIKLNDFGLSDVVHIENRETKVGSFYYMAPEIHTNSPYDESVDLFSAGVLLFELFYGRKPFPVNIPKPDYIEMMRLKRPIVYPREKTEKLPRDGVDLMRGLLSYEKHERNFNNQIVHHPFLKIGNVSSHKHHYNKGCESLITSVKFAKDGRFSTAYVEVTEAILHLKVYCESMRSNEGLYAYLRKKLKEYDSFRNRLKDHVLQRRITFLEPAFMPMQDEKLRCMLMSMPHLLDAYDLCLVGEMCILKGNVEIGTQKLEGGFQKLSVDLPKEPDSEHKSLLLVKNLKKVDTSFWENFTSLPSLETWQILRMDLLISFFGYYSFRATPHLLQTLVENLEDYKIHTISFLDCRVEYTFR